MNEAVTTAVVALGLWDGDVDSDGMPCTFHNHYVCDECDVAWSDYWSCACDSDCPKCGEDYSPQESDEWDFEQGCWGYEVRLLVKDVKLDD